MFALLVEKHEEKTWVISELDPIEAIKIRMEPMHLKQQDLVPYIGNQRPRPNGTEYDVDINFSERHNSQKIMPKEIKEFILYLSFLSDKCNTI